MAARLGVTHHRRSSGFQWKGRPRIGPVADRTEVGRLLVRESQATLVFLFEEGAQGFRKPGCAAREGAVSGQSAGVEGGIGNVADELAGVGPFDAEGCFHSRFNRVLTADLQQDHVEAAALQLPVEAGVVARVLYSKALVGQYTLQVAPGAFRIAG